MNLGIFMRLSKRPAKKRTLTKSKTIGCPGQARLCIDGLACALKADVDRKKGKRHAPSARPMRVRKAITDEHSFEIALPRLKNRFSADQFILLLRCNCLLKSRLATLEKTTGGLLKTVMCP